MKNRIELLAPAGSYESMRAAFAAGADAAYIGGMRFGARAYADNLDEENLKRAIDEAHEKNKKLYLTVNTLLKDGELDELYAYLNPLYREGLDAVIVQDMGVLRYVRDVFPGLAIHASTQMGVTGPYGARFLREQGASRVVTARELSLAEIRAIHAQTDIEIESFVHGALCFCYSGQCLLSSMIGGRSGNRGRCAQPCRLPYGLSGCGRKGGESGRYLLSPKDICTLDILPELAESGIYSFKIEGRMKRAEYTAGVVRVYRRCLDRYLSDGAPSCRVAEEEKRELLDLYNRGGFSTGYYHQHNGPEMMARVRPNHYGIAAAQVQGRTGNKTLIRALEALHAGDVLEYREGGQVRETTLNRTIERRETAAVAFPGAVELRRNAVLYRTHNETLLQNLKNEFIDRTYAEKINGKLILSAQKPAILNLYYGNYKCSAQGACPQKALSRPLSLEDIEKQMRRTGGSGFVFDRLEIQAEPDLFLPVQALNELRRSAVAALKEEIRRTYLRPDGAYRPPERVRAFRKAGEGALEPDRRSGAEQAGRTRLSASIENPEALPELCRTDGIERIYIDCGAHGGKEDFLRMSGRQIEQCHVSGRECWYIMPWIFRAEALRFYDAQALDVLGQYDGVLLRSQEEYAFLKAHGYEGKMAADWNLYTFNREARAFWQELGLAFDTASPELNRRELQERGCGGSELIVYGYQPLMVSAQCQVKNACGCDKTPRVLYLEDRRQKRFAVKNHCAFCYNTIYNCAPLELMDRADEIQKLGAAVRLQFTVEDPGTVRRVARAYAERFVRGGSADRINEEFTRGHFERGVE